MAGRVQRAPRRVEQIAVQPRRDLHRRPWVRRLGPEVDPDVGLIPDRPEVHPRQRTRRAGGSEMPAVAGPDRMHPVRIVRGVGLPLRLLARGRGAPPRGPQGRLADQRQVDADMTRRQSADERVIARHRGIRIGIPGVEGRLVRRAGVRRDRPPVQIQAHEADSEALQKVHVRRRVRVQLRGHREH